MADIHAIVTTGYPAYELELPYHRGLGDIIHYERHDRSKYGSGQDIVKFLYNLREWTKPAYDQENTP